MQAIYLTQYRDIHARPGICKFNKKLMIMSFQMMIFMQQVMLVETLITVSLGHLCRQLGIECDVVTLYWTAST